MTTFFQELLFSKLPNGGVHGRDGYVPLSNSIVKSLPQFAKKYSRNEIELALKLLGEIDVLSKTTAISNESEMTKFIFNLLENNDR